MKAKSSKTIKSVRLSNLSGVYDVSVGHGVPSSERSPRNYSKSNHEQRHDPTPSFDDVRAREQRWGLKF